MKREMQNGLERCCRAAILKVLLKGSKNHRGKRAAHNHRSGKKANTPGVELWGTNSGKERRMGEWRG